jgi:tRNA-dihydrouridine synthase B
MRYRNGREKRSTKTVKIGPYAFDHPVILSPMAGVSDLPFRRLCRRFGADYTITEMIAARSELWQTDKTRKRLDFGGEPAPRFVQIAGGDADMMAECAVRAQALGADIIDINMGCPAKKVCNKLAGSALLRDEPLVYRILSAVCRAVRVPVSLKIRTGWDPAHRNGLRIAQIAEQCGISAISVHGRTRTCGYRGVAEYDTIASIKQQVSIPVIANGDINGGARARMVLAKTGADGIMIGRAAHGNPWIFTEIKAALAGTVSRPPDVRERLSVMREHLAALHTHYGEYSGVRIARKHIGWYFNAFREGRSCRSAFNRLNCADEQLEFIETLTAQSNQECAA